MAAKRPRRDDSIVDLLSELSNRPAMNGGFSRLAKQQDEQCERLERVEAWIEPWEKRFRQLRNVGYAVLVGILVVLVKDWIAHVHVVLQ